MSACKGEGAPQQQGEHCSMPPSLQRPAACHTVVCLWGNAHTRSCPYHVLHLLRHAGRLAGARDDDDDSLPHLTESDSDEGPGAGAPAAPLPSQQPETAPAETSSTACNGAASSSTHAPPQSRGPKLPPRPGRTAQQQHAAAAAAAGTGAVGAAGEAGVPAAAPVHVWVGGMPPSVLAAIEFDQMERERQELWDMSRHDWVSDGVRACVRVCLQRVCVCVRARAHASVHACVCGECQPRLPSALFEAHAPMTSSSHLIPFSFSPPLMLFIPCRRAWAHQGHPPAAPPAAPLPAGQQRGRAAGAQAAAPPVDRKGRGAVRGASLASRLGSWVSLLLREV